MKLFYDIAGTRVDQVPSSPPHNYGGLQFNVTLIQSSSSQIVLLWNLLQSFISLKCLPSGDTSLKMCQNRAFCVCLSVFGRFRQVLIVSHGQFTTTHLVRSTNTCNTISNNSRYTMCVTHATQFWSTSTTHPTKVQILHSFIARYQQPGNLFEETRLEAFSFGKVELTGRRLLSHQCSGVEISETRSRRGNPLGQWKSNGQFWGLSMRGWAMGKKVTHFWWLIRHKREQRSRTRSMVSSK